MSSESPVEAISNWAGLRKWRTFWLAAAHSRFLSLQIVIADAARSRRNWNTRQIFGSSTYRYNYIIVIWETNVDTSWIDPGCRFN